MRLNSWLSAFTTSVTRRNVSTDRTTRRRRSIKDRLERLEDRVLLTVSASFSVDTLTVTLGNSGDQAFVSYDGTNIDIGTSDGGRNVYNGNDAITKLVIQDAGSNANQTVTFSGSLAFPALISVSTIGIETAAVQQSIPDSTTVSGNTTTVNVSASGRIQDGIDLASSGATVDVAAGTYLGDLVLNKAVTLAFGTSVVEIRGDNINLAGSGGTITGTGSITFSPASDSTSIGINGGAGTLQFSHASLQALPGTLAGVAFGHAGTGAHDIIFDTDNGITLPFAVTFNAQAAGGSFDVIDSNSGNGVSALKTSGTGSSITVNGSGATTTLSTDWVTAGAPIVINDNVILAATTITLDTTNGGAVPAGAAITIQTPGTIDADAAANTRNLVLTAGTGGAVTLGGAIGSTARLDNLTVTAASVSALPILKLDGDLSITTTGAAITQSGAATVVGLTSISAGARAITLTQSNDFTGAVSLSNSGANAVAVIDANAIVIGTTSVGSTFNVTANGTITQTGTISATTLTTSSVGGTDLGTLTNTVTGFNATNTSSGAIALNNSTATLTITGVTETGSGGVTITNAGNVSTTGAIASNTTAAPVNLTATGSDVNLTIDGNVTSTNGAITLLASGNVTVSTGRTIASGTAATLLGADLTAAQAGDNGTGTLTVNNNASISGATITLRGANIDVSGTPNVGSNSTTTQLTVRSSLSARPMSVGGANNAVSGINLTDAELGRFLTTAAGTITFGDSSQTGDITFTSATTATTAGAATVVIQSTAGAGKIVLDDESASTALNGNGGTISLTAGSGGITAASANNTVAEISTTGATVTLNTAGAIGTSTNRIQFANNTNTAQQNVVIGSTNQASSVSLDGLGSVTLGSILGGTANTSIDVTARAALVVLGSATLSSGTSSLSLGADLTAAQAGDNGTGTLTINSGAAVTGTTVTLRGADIDVLGTATVGSNSGTTGLTVRSSQTSRPISLGGLNNAVAGINLTDAELGRLVTTSGGTVTIGDSNQTGNITFTTATVATTAGAATTVVQATAGVGQIIFDNEAGAGASLNGNTGNVTLTAGTGGIVEAAGNTTGATDISNSANTSLTSAGAIGTSGKPVQIGATNLTTNSAANNSSQFLSATGAVTIAAGGISAGTGSLNLNVGTFTLGGSDRINDNTKLSVNGATFAMSTFNETVDTATLTSGSITGSGILTSTNNFQVQSGSISAVLASSNGLIKSTGGTVTLTGANTYAGTTTISAGTLAIGASNVIPDGAGKGDVSLAGTLAFAGDFSEIINGLSGSGTIDKTTGSGTSTLTIGNNNVTSSFGGAINNTSGTVAVTKTGSGTLTFSGSNGYTGATTISNGTLLVNGSTAAGSAVAVNSGGTLGGTGTVNGGVTVNTGAKITGGDLGTIGTLTVGSLAFNGGTYQADLLNNSSDTITTAGAVNLNSGTAGVLTLTGTTGGTTTAGTVFTLINNTHASNALANPPLTNALEGATQTVNTQTARYTYLGGVGGNDLTLTVDNTGATTFSGSGALELRRITASGVDNIQFLVGGVIQDSRPFNSITSLVINGGTGNDTLNINYTATGGFLGKDIVFNGGSGTDTLNITGGTFGRTTYNYTNANDGNIQSYSDAAGTTLLNTVTYTGLAPISNTGTVTNIIFNLPNVTNAATLGDDGTGSNGMSRLSSGGTFELTDFANPTGSVTINGGSGTDTFTINALPDFNAALTIDGGSGTDTITLASAITLGSATATGALTFTAETINLNASINTDAGSAAGGGNVSLSGATAITLGANVVIDTDRAAGTDGDITINNALNADNAASNRTLTLTAGTGAIALQNVGVTTAVQTLTVTSAATTSLQQVTTQSGGISLTSTAITLNNNLSTDAASTAGTVAITGAVTLGGSVTIDTDSTTDASITFTGAGSTINGGNTLSLTAGTGNIGFGGNLGATTALTSVTVNIAADVTFSGTVRTTGNVNQAAGTGTTTFNGTSGGGIGGTLSVTTNTITLNTATTTVVSTATLTAANGVNLNAGLSATTVTINADSDGNNTGTLTTVAAGTITATTGNVTITAADVVLAGTISANGGTGDVFLQNSASLRTIGLAGGAGNFSVDDAEADLISASRLVIGTSTAAAITVGGTFSPATPTTLHLRTNGGVSGAGSITVSNLAISANGTVALNTANSVTNLAIVTGTGSISFTESNGLNVADVVTPSGTISGVTAATTVSLTVNAGNLTVQNTGAANDISATAFTATVSAADAVFNLNASANVQTSAGATITADDMDLQGTITATGQTVLLQPNAAGQQINVGSAGTAANGILELSDPELDRVTAGTIQIGRASSGALSVSAAIDTQNTTVLHLITGSTVSQTGVGAITEGSLAITAGGAVSMSTNTNTVSNLAITTTTGNVSFLNNTTLTVTDVDAVAGISTGAGSVTLTNSTGDVTVANSGATNDINATTGITISLSANNATFTVNGSAIVATVGNVATNDIIVNADEMVLNGQIQASGSNQIVTLRNTTAGKTIVLGANPATANTLELSDAELDNVSAGNVLRIGRNDAAASGTISFQGSVTAPAGWTVLKLLTGADVSDDNPTNPDITVANLAINSVSGIGAAGGNAANGLEILVTNLAFNNTTSNSVEFTEATGGLGYTINSVDGILTSNNGGTTTTLTALSPVTFAVNDISVGSIVVNATETGATDFDNITVNAGVTVQSTSGDVTFNAGDRIVLNNTSIVQSNTGNVTLNSGVGDTDNDGQQTLDGTITAAITVTINLNQEANAGATQAASGTITAANLRLLSSAGTPGGGSFSLGTSTTNDVTTIAAAADGSIVYRDATSLTVGTVTTVGVTTSNDDILLQTGGSLTINNVLTSGTGDIRLVIATSVTQAAAGNVVGDELGIRAGGVVTLSTSTTNDVNTLAVNTTDVVEFRDVDDLTIGTVAASGNFLATSGITTTNDDVNLRTGNSLAVNQVISAGTADVRIVAGNSGVVSISQSAAGVITADELGIIATRNVGLAAAQSDVNTIAVNTTNGTIDFIDSDDLIVGAVAAGGTNGFTGATGITSGGNDVYLETNGAGGTLAINNAINTGAGDLRLEASAATTQTAAITASGLALTDQGPFTLTLATNSVTTLAANSANTIAYVNAGSLIVGTVTIQTTSIGPVSTVGIATSNDDVRIVATTGSITINNTINLSNGGGGGSGGSLDLVATTGATQAGAANILANTLLLRGTGAAINTNVFNLPNATNNVAIIAANLTNGAVTYYDADALTVGISSVTAGGSTTTATGITVGNPVSVAPAGGDVFLRAGQVAPFTGLLTVTQLINTNAGTFGNLTLGGGVVFSGAGNTNVGSGDIDLEGGAAVPDIIIDTPTTHNMTGGTVTYRPDRDIFINQPVIVNNGHFILDADGEDPVVPTTIAQTSADLGTGNGIGGTWIRNAGSVDVNTGAQGGGSLVIAGSQINNTPNGGAPYGSLVAGTGVQIDNTSAATEVTAATTISLLVKTITGLGSAVNDMQIDGNIIADAGGPINVQVEDTFTLNSTLSLTTEGNITIDAQDMVINTTTAVIDAKEAVGGNASGIVWLRNRTAGRTIDLGQTGLGQLQLSNPELNRISPAQVVRIGRNDAQGAGTLTVSAANINLTQNTTLHLITSADIVDDGTAGDGTITETNLALEAGIGIDLDNVVAIPGVSGNDVDNLSIRVTGGGAANDAAFKDVDDINFAVIDGVASPNAVNVVSDVTIIAGGPVTQSAAIVAGGLELIDLFNDPNPPLTFLAFPNYYLPNSSNQIGRLEAYSQRSVNVTNSIALAVDTVANTYRTFPASGSSGIWVQSLQLTAPSVSVNLPIETNDELGFVTFDVTTLLDINANIFSRGKIEQIGTGSVVIDDIQLRTTDDNITFLGGVTLDGASLVTPTILSTDANWTTPFTGIPLAANAAAQTGGGSIVFNSTLRSSPSGDTAAAYRGNDLTLQTGTGDIQFVGQVGGAGLHPVSLATAGRLGVVNIVIAHDVTASTGFAANAIYQQAGDGETRFNGFTQTNGRRDVLAPLAATNFGIDITTKMITLNAGMSTTSAPGSGASAAIRLNNSGTLSIIAGAGSINSDGPVSQVGTGDNLVGGDIVTTNDDISFASDTYLAGSPLQINAGTEDVSFAKRFQINNKTVTIRDKDFVDLGTVTAIAGGVLNVFVGNTATRGKIQAGSGEIITGAGTLNADVDVLTGGTLAPAMDASGLGTGILTINGNTVLGTNAVYAVDLNGVVAGSSYDQVVTGATFTFNATNAILSANRPITFNPTTGSVLKIIDGSVDVIGNFANATNGSYIYVNGLYFLVAYDATAGDLTLTRQDPPGSSVFIIDDNGSSPSTPVTGFTLSPNTTAAWSPNSVAGRGYANDLRFAPSGTGSSTALYTFTGLVPGHTYRVSTTWFPHINRATDAPFTVDDGAGGNAPVTTTINQRNTPDDFTYGGSAWEDLVTGGYTISGTTLTVLLTNNTATGYVVADAVRIEDVTGAAPEIVVMDGTDDIADGTGVVDFGTTTTTGADVTKTITIKNTGLSPLYLTSATITPPPGFTISGYVPQTIAAGATGTPFTITLSHLVAGNYSGQILFNTNDLDENPFNFTVKGGVTSAATQIADNLAAGAGYNTITGTANNAGTNMMYGEVGLWHNNDDAKVGYLKDLRYAAANSNAQATWTFSGLAAGTYRVSVTYRAESNRASNASFTVAGTGVTTTTVGINQRVAPNQFQDANVWWTDLASTFGTVSAGGTITVTLNALGSNGFVIADAVRIEFLHPVQAAAGPAADPTSTVLTTADLDATAAAAIARWQQASLTPAQQTALNGIVFAIADLPAAYLGSETSATIFVDANAAGYGWYVDTTPYEDTEFGVSMSPTELSATDPLAASHMDLLTVLMHEIGHRLGLDDISASAGTHDLMTATIDVGTRRLPVTVSGLSTEDALPAESTDSANNETQDHLFYLWHQTSQSTPTADVPPILVADANNSSSASHNDSKSLTTETHNSHQRPHRSGGKPHDEAHGNRSLLGTLFNLIRHRNR